MKKMLLLINPASGKSALRSQLLEIIDAFIKGGYDVNTVVTQSTKHLSKTIKERAEDFDTIVCCGGDGTLNHTVRAMCELKTPLTLGYIPCGTTNDFAKSRGISAIPLNAAQQIANGEEHEIDVGFFGDRPYAYIAAFGVFSDVSYSTPRHLKQNIGHAAYVIEGIKSLDKKNQYHIKFKIGSEEIEGDFMYGMFSNTRRVGGFELPIISDFNIDDGMIDVILVRSPKIVDQHLKLINALITQQSDDDVVYKFRASSIEYESDSEIPWTLDGEYGGSFKKQTIKIRRKLLKMLY